MKGHLYIISDFPDDYTHTPQGQLGSTASTGHNPLAALPISPSPTIICNNNKKKKMYTAAIRVTSCTTLLSCCVQFPGHPTISL